MKSKSTTSKIMISTFVLSLLVLLGFLIHNSMSIGLAWDNSGHNIFDLTYSIENNTLNVVQSTVVRQSGGQYSMYLYLLYLDGNYQGYKKEFTDQGSDVLHEEWEIPLSEIDVNSEHRLKTKIFVFGPEAKDTINSMDVTNPDCSSGQTVHINESGNWAIYAEFYSKIPCSGLSNTIDPSSVLEERNLTAYISTTPPFYLKNVINITTTMPVYLNVSGSTPASISNTTNSTNGGVDVVIWSSFATGLIVIIIVIIFAMKKAKKK